MSNIVGILSKHPNILKELQKQIPNNYNLIFKEICPASEAVAENVTNCEILLADYDLLIPQIQNIKNTKWIQGTWAGVEKFLPHFTKDKFEGKIVTRFSGIHFGRMMSEYVTTQIVNYERDMFQIKQDQQNAKYNRNSIIMDHRVIADLCIGILGVGVIGNQIAHTLNNFGATIMGYGKRSCLPQTDEYKIYQEYYNGDSLPDLLNNCDYVVNVLPSTPETKGLLNGDILKNCTEKQSVFINIGRGDIINESDLIKSLNNKWIKHAILDVFQTEPLPEDSPLWKHEQVFITPHIAGISRAKDIVEQFKINYDLYKKGQPIATQLKYDQNY